MAKSQMESVKTAGSVESNSAARAVKNGQSESPFETFDFLALDTGLEAMLAAGVHFGHLKSRLHPSMREFVFLTRQNVNIIDLDKTKQYLDRAGKFLSDTAKAGKPILFVGMKKHTHPFIISLSKRLGEHYVIERWLGGTLTNYSVIRTRTKYFRETEEKLERGEFQMYTKFERQRKLEEVERLRKRMGGIKEMRELPGAVVVADGKEGKLAIREAHALGIPVVAIIDTNTNATDVEYPIPGNDDALSSLRLLLGSLGKAVAEAKGLPAKN